MNRLLLPLLVVAGLMFTASPAAAQRFRVAPTYRAPVSKPVETNYSSSPSYSSGYYSSSSSSYSSSDSDRSDFDFRLICMIIIFVCLVIRVLCGIIGFFVWIGRSVMS